MFDIYMSGHHVAKRCVDFLPLLRPSKQFSMLHAWSGIPIHRRLASLYFTSILPLSFDARLIGIGAGIGANVHLK
jgi:hypothetical protein